MATASWKIDPTHSTVEFTAKHMMFTTVKGRFADVEGTVTTDGDDPGSARVNVTSGYVSTSRKSAERR